MICAWLLFNYRDSTPTEAIDLFAEMRTNHAKSMPEKMSRTLPNMKPKCSQNEAQMGLKINEKSMRKND